MAQSTILDAIRAYDERKDAAAIPEHGEHSEDVIRLVMSDLDLDFDELLSLQRVLLPAPVKALMAGEDPRSIVFGMWVDGLATGLFLAKMREEAGD